MQVRDGDRHRGSRLLVKGAISRPEAGNSATFSKESEGIVDYWPEDTRNRHQLPKRDTNVYDGSSRGPSLMMIT